LLRAAAVLRARSVGPPSPVPLSRLGPLGCAVTTQTTPDASVTTQTVGAEQAHHSDQATEVAGALLVEQQDAGDVEDDSAGATGHDRLEQSLGELGHADAVELADDRHSEHVFPQVEDRRRERVDQGPKRASMDRWRSPSEPPRDLDVPPARHD